MYLFMGDTVHMKRSQWSIGFFFLSHSPVVYSIFSQKHSIFFLFYLPLQSSALVSSVGEKDLFFLFQFLIHRIHFFPWHYSLHFSFSLGLLVRFCISLVFFFFPFFFVFVFSFFFFFSLARFSVFFLYTPVQNLHPPPSQLLVKHKDN